MKKEVFYISAKTKKDAEKALHCFKSGKKPCPGFVSRELGLAQRVMPAHQDSVVYRVELLVAVEVI